MIPEVSVVCTKILSYILASSLLLDLLNYTLGSSLVLDLLNYTLGLSLVPDLLNCIYLFSKQAGINYHMIPKVSVVKNPKLYSGFISGARPVKLYSGFISSARPAKLYLSLNKLLFIIK